MYQKEFAELSKTVPNIQFVEGFPNDLYDMTDAHDSSMVILDDLMSQCSNDQRVVDLFTRGSSSWNNGFISYSEPISAW